jgi:hypothetical protein
MFHCIRLFEILSKPLPFLKLLLSFILLCFTDALVVLILSAIELVAETICRLNEIQNDQINCNNLLHENCFHFNYLNVYNKIYELYYNELVHIFKMSGFWGFGVLGFWGLF